MDRRTHHMTDPSPQRLSREEACAIDKKPPPMQAGTSREAVVPSPSTERLPDPSWSERRSTATAGSAGTAPAGTAGAAIAPSDSTHPEAAGTAVGITADDPTLT
ncbi:hypothetical protein [Methylobacterium sp. CM6246]|jgi:hypothetical protein